MIQDIMTGFVALGDPAVIGMLLLGNILGYVFGMLPGLAGLQAMALVLPFTYGLEPIKGMYLYAGIMGASTLGGAITAILINIPGTPSNIATTIEGYAMTKRGEAARALSISTFASMFGTFFAFGVIVIILPVIERLILMLRAPEIFWIIVLGLLSIVFIVRGNFFKGVVSALVGILLALVGSSPIFPVSRFDMGVVYFRDGINLVAFFVGIFAIPEILELIAGQGTITTTSGKQGRKQIIQGLKDVIGYPVTFFRSSVIGTIVGLIPGLGGSVANTVAYTTTVQLVKVRKDQRPFGSGNIEGLVACESANNAKDGGALLTTVAFGIPGSPEMAILLAALVLHGLQPGLLLITNHADIVWVLLFGLFFSQFITGFWTLTALRWFARISTLKTEFVVFPVLLACLVGGYAVHKNIWDVFIMVGAGFLAFAMRRFGFNVIAMAIGFVLGVTAEITLMQSLSISLGRISILFTRPISIAILAIVLLLIIFPFWHEISRLIWRRPKPRNIDKTTPRIPVEQAESNQESSRQSEKKRLNRGDVLFELILFLIFAAVFYSSLRLGRGAGTFPFVISALAMMLLLPIIFGEFIPRFQRYFGTGLDKYLPGGSREMAPESALGELHRTSSAKKVRGMATLILILLIAVFFVGFFVAVPVCFLVYLAVWQKMRWKTAIIFSALTAAALFFGFDNLLQHTLWRGAIPELIPGLVGGETLPLFF